MDTDRNLLFGVLAMQFELLAPVRFVEACAIWSSRKHVPLAEILVERGWLTAAERDEVERLLLRKLERNQGDARKTLAETADLSVRHALNDLPDSFFQETASHLPPPKHFVELETIEYQAGSRSHYTLSRLHGEGGIGRVWLARDGKLNRSVALKELRPDKGASDDSLRRFVKEAQITCQLEHPNIVPVYELGTGEREGVFYTMRFVRGRTLRDAITAYYQQVAEGRPDPVAFRQLLSALVGICHAIAFAHARGVVHRDLKPANVMLGAFGEVVVLDWGLAKVIGQPDDEDLPPIAITHEAETEHTLQGMKIGTWAYMSPEQAEGRPDLMDGRTDVYSLGAILFHILTNKPPHHAENTTKIEQQILQGPSPRALDVTPQAPAALDAICQAAMAHRPRDRYQTATELAEDLERWLADEPVRVYLESRSARLGRWMRRHRTWTQAIGAALVLVTIVAIIAAVWVERSRRDEAFARREALSRFQESQETVDTMLTGVGEILQHYPGTKQVRAKLLQKAAESYERFARDGAAQGELRIESGRAWVRVGNVRYLLGEHEAAAKAYRAAIQAFESMPATLRPAAAVDVVLARTKLGNVLAERGDGKSAAEELNRAYEMAKSLDDSPLARFTLATVLLQRGQSEQVVGADALDDLRRSESLLEKLVGEAIAPDDQTRYLANLALVRSLRGQRLVKLGDNSRALPLLETTVRTHEDLVRTDEHHPPFLEGLAFSQINWANALRTQVREQQQEELLQLAIDNYGLLVESMPGVPRFVENRAVARSNLGWLQHQAGKNELALKTLSDAAVDLKSLADSPNWLPQHVDNFAKACVVLAQVQGDLEDDEQAAGLLRLAIEAYETRLPGDARTPRGVGTAHRHLGRLSQKAEDVVRATAEFELAIQHLEQARKLAPDPFATDELALVHEHLGDLKKPTDESAANRHFQQALELRKQLPHDPSYRFKRASLLSKFSDRQRQQEAVTLARELSSDFTHVPRFRTLLGAAQLRAGQAAEAIRTLEGLDPSEIPGNSPHDFWRALAYSLRNEPGARELASPAQKEAVDRMGKSAPGNPDLLLLRREVEQRFK